MKRQRVYKVEFIENCISIYNCDEGVNEYIDVVDGLLVKEGELDTYTQYGIKSVQLIGELLTK